MTDKTILVVRDENIVSEKWTFGHYEIDGIHVDRGDDAELKLSARRYDTKSEVIHYLHKNLPDSEWQYDIFRVVTVFDFEKIDNT